jgi:general secretion pathway protein J
MKPNGFTLLERPNGFTLLEMPNGFTLLEMLVALAVFGFLLVGISQTVQFGLIAWHQETRLSGGKADLEAVDRTLRSVVENLVPQQDPSRASIYGTPDTMAGVTRLRVPGSGLQAVPIGVALAVSGNRLVLRWLPYQHRVPFVPPSPPNETDIVEGVARLRVEYWQSPGVWVSSWREPDLPLLIRFRVILSGGNPQRWPDIIVAPLLSRP